MCGILISNSTTIGQEKGPGLGLDKRGLYRARVKVGRFPWTSKFHLCPEDIHEIVSKNLLQSGLKTWTWQKPLNPQIFYA